MTKGRNQHLTPRDGGWAVKRERGRKPSRSAEPSARRLTAAARFPATSFRSSSSTDGTAESASATTTVTTPIRRRAEAERARTVQARTNIGE
jgi:hypothetical protein